VFGATATLVLPLTLVNALKVLQILCPGFGLKVWTKPALAIVVDARISLVFSDLTHGRKFFST